MGKFPFVRFGICPVCGGGGPADVNASGVDAATDRTEAVEREAVADADDDINISEANGYRLYFYRGELMCRMCIKEKEEFTDGELAASKHKETADTLAKAGFVKEVANE